MKRILCFAAMICLMISCGMPKEKGVTVSNVEITGLIKDYVKVVDGSYKFTNDGDDAFITVKFELTKVNVGAEIYRKKHPEYIRINPIGETEEIFDTGTYGFTTSRTETSKLKDLINTGGVGDTKNISFKWDYFGNKSNKNIAQLIFEKSASFEIIDNTFTFAYELSAADIHWDDMESAGISSSGSSKSSGSSDWDKALDEYEKYIDSYVKLMKKVTAGDMSAMTEYATMLEKIGSLAEKLDNAEGSMTTAQASRYLKITTKMGDALQ